MKNRKLIVLLAVLAAAFIAVHVFRAVLVRKIARERQGITADYVCDGNRTIHAVFYAGSDPRAEIALSDGRKMTLRQALSASGARYASADGKIVLWVKGENAFIEENGKETYANGKASD